MSAREEGKRNRESLGAAITTKRTVMKAAWKVDGIMMACLRMVASAIETIGHAIPLSCSTKA